MPRQNCHSELVEQNEKVTRASQAGKRLQMKKMQVDLCETFWMLFLASTNTNYW
jgi:hypothetical protein